MVSRIDKILFMASVIMAIYFVIQGRYVLVIYYMVTLIAYALQNIAFNLNRLVELKERELR